MSDECLMLIGSKYLFPLKEKFKDLGDFYTGFGWVFPSQSETALSSLISALPHVAIHRIPLAQGQTFAGYRQIYTANFLRKNLVELEHKITQATRGLALKEFTADAIQSASLDEKNKEQLLHLLLGKNQLLGAIEHAEGLAKALNASPSQELSLKFIADISPDYFKVNSPEKPVLLEYCKEEGPHAKKISFMHKEIIAMLVAEGGRGKTHLCALLAACVVTGIPFLGKFSVREPGAVCFIVGENNNQDIHRLLWKTRANIEKMIAENEKKPAYERFPLFKNATERLEHLLCPVSVHGINASLVDAKGRPTLFFEGLLKQLKIQEPAEGWQLIIFDPASRFAGPEAEKDNAIATAFIACLEMISDNLRGKPTILLSHHKSKSGTKESAGQVDARGSSALTDGARWQANLTRDKEDDTITIFDLPKTNFTPPIEKFRIKKRFDGIPEFSSWVDKKKEPAPSFKKKTKKHDPRYSDDDEE